jgi:hypothetical protein
MRRLTAVLVALALAPAAACKKDPPKGLPPATEWSSSATGSSEAAPPSPSPSPSNANPHGPGVMANPHGPAATAGNPHENVDPSGAAGSPHDAVMPQKTSPRTLEKLPDGRAALGPFSIAIPAGWTEKPITSSMRAAQFALSSDPGAEAELVVYYFGESGAGGVQDNLDRWLGQFQQPSGKPSKDVAKIEQATFAGQAATLVSVSGRYVTTAMPGGGDLIDKSDQSLLGAIVASPKGPYYFKLVGAKKTVDAQTPKVRAMLASMKLR